MTFLAVLLLLHPWDVSKWNLCHRNAAQYVDISGTIRFKIDTRFKTWEDMGIARLLRTDELGATLLISILLEMSELCFGNSHLLQEAALLDPALHPSCATGICSLRVLKTGWKCCKYESQETPRAQLHHPPPEALQESCQKGQRQTLITKSSKERCSDRPWPQKAAKKDVLQEAAWQGQQGSMARTQPLRQWPQGRGDSADGATGSCQHGVCSSRSQDPVPSSPKRIQTITDLYTLGNRTWSDTSPPQE